MRVFNAPASSISHGHDMTRTARPRELMGPPVEVTDSRTGTKLQPGQDADADNAVKHANTVLDFYKTVLNRDSIDGAGMLVEMTVHEPNFVGNAAWDGAGVLFGEGDGRDFKPLTGALDAIGHELTHGVNHFSNQLKYQGQSGALDESFADVMGEAAQIWHEAGGDATWGTVETARSHKWESGEDAVLPTSRYKAISDLGNPERTDLVMTQPSHMKDFLFTSRDNGGVHTNSGIPSKVAYNVAQELGTEKLVKIWYDTMMKHIEPRSDFKDAAQGTIESAKLLYGDAESSAVKDAWKAVGVLDASA